MNIDQIIAALSEPQKAAVCGRYAWVSPADEDEGEQALYRLGLWNPKPKYGAGVLTPLGVSVRTRLLTGRFA